MNRQKNVCSHWRLWKPEGGNLKKITIRHYLWGKNVKFH